MEDEQGDAVQGSNDGGVSVMPLSEKLPTEPFNMGGENEVYESFEEGDGDGDEIMIEVVGSDVFVNGVSGQKEGCLVSGEFEDLEGHAWVNREEIEGRNYSVATDGDKMEESEVGFLGSREEHDYVVISEEKAIKDEFVDKDSANLVISDVLSRPMEAFVEGNIGIAEKERVLSSNDDVGNVDHLGEDSVMSHEAANLSDGSRVNVTQGEVLVTCCPEDAVFGAVGVKLVDEKVLAAGSKDSILGTGALVSDVQDENEGCLNELHGITHASREISCVSESWEVKDVKFDGVLNFEDGASDIDLRDVNCVGNEPTERDIGGEIAEMSEDDDLNIEIQADTEENQSCDEVNDEAEENSSKANGFDVAEGYTYKTKQMGVEDERESDRKHNGKKMIDDSREPELETLEAISETDNFELSNEETMNSLRMNRPHYLLHEGSFVQSDLVWGKVRSHPWWPGQIFDPSDASENSVRYYRKESYLVAYFGDRTFAWLDKSNLKPFRSYFSEMESQSNSEAFQNAVTSALEEVSRRVESGLSCSCVPKGVYGKIESQVVDNAGIREQSSHRYGVDHSSRASCFEPDKFLEYVINLAPFAFSGANRLDLVIARGQMSAFYRFKGYRCLTEFDSYGELLENDAGSEKMSDKKASSKKRKITPKSGSRCRKERSSMDFMGDDKYFQHAKNMGKSVPSSSGKKRKAFDRQPDGSNKRLAKVSNTMSQNPRPLFKIGECIRRAASRLTGSTSLVKRNSNAEMEIDGSEKIYEQSENKSVFVSEESFSAEEMLSQLELAAQNPKKNDDFRHIRIFFTGFRSSTVSSRRALKKQCEQKIGGYGEKFEFDDLYDSYWTDRVVQNNSEEKSIKAGRKLHSRKRFFDTAAVMELDESVKRREQESSPAELILNFAERKCVQSEINLNKMFRRFGPLMESKTEVDRDSGRARLIFKRGFDAEVALNSAKKINIFGPAVVNYEIGYSPLISVEILPIATPQCQEDETLMI